MMIISHPAIKEYQRKPLAEHLANVAEGSRSRIQRLSLSTKLITKDHLEGLAFKIGLMHDLGKASIFFQEHIRGKNREPLSHHSLVSAIALYYVLIDDNKFADFALIAFKAVQRHHGNLSAFGTERLSDRVLISNTLKIYNSVLQQIKNDQNLTNLFHGNSITLPHLDKDKIEKLGDELYDFEKVEDADDAVERFLIQNLLFSVLLDADKHDAARIAYKTDQQLKQAISYSPNQYIKTFKKKESKLNAIRSDLLSAASSINADMGKCFAMSAPTGSGKTLACLGFANALQLSLQKQRRLIYCLPYTSIIDQNHEEICKVLKANGMDAKESDLLLKHHHLVDFSSRNASEQPKEDYDLLDYQNDSLIVNSWGSACIVSSFVQLFHSLIGSKNSLVRKLHNIVNSIILLDEVQNLPPKYYLLLRRIFYVLANRFDTYILTCTATQPFIYEPDSFLEISPKGLFDHEVFNRVSLEIVNKTQSIEEFAESLDLEGTLNVLFVLNTKKSAIELYQILQERYGSAYQTFCLTTYHLPILRLDRIEQIKKQLKAGKPLILVSTQLIEAGVDLSFQKVYRDMGPLDSIIQVAGRCNRHGELGVLGGKMQLLNLVKDEKSYATMVYDGYVLDKTNETLSGYDKLESKDFAKLIKSYYHSLEFEATSSAIMNAIKDLNYDQDRIRQLAIDRFKLIEESYPTSTLFIPHSSEARKALQNLLNAQNELKDADILDEITESKLRLTIKESYNKLSSYQLNLTRNDLKNYSRSMSYYHKLCDDVYYISAEGIEAVYDESTGFVLEPVYRGAALSF